MRDWGKHVLSTWDSGCTHGPVGASSGKSQSRCRKPFLQLSFSFVPFPPPQSQKSLLRNTGVTEELLPTRPYRFSFTSFTFHNWCHCQSLGFMASSEAIHLPAGAQNDGSLGWLECCAGTLLFERPISYKLREKSNDAHSAMMLTLRPASLLWPTASICICLGTRPFFIQSTIWQSNLWSGFQK